MSRITYKDKNGNYQLDNDYVSERGIDENGLGEITDYIGELEDLEEQLGCSLEVVFKALKNGIYIYNKNYEPNFRKEKVLYLGNEYGRYYITWLGCWTEYLDNYKKTWWLKEDRSEQKNG